MDKKDINYEAYVAGLVARAREAQKVANGYDQARVDELTAAVAWAACNEEFRMKAAEMLVEESKIGVVQDKFNKIRNKALGVYRDMKGEKSVGIIETDVDHGLVKYIKPMGVIGALIPITNGEATPIVKTLWALKSRNAIIMAPHPGGRKTCLFVVNYIREVLKKYGAPEDLVMTIEPEYVAVECSGQLMKQVDFVVATGGTPMVRAAYSSGTPAIGVGTGNVTTYIDESADLKDAASKIRQSKMFDNASSCSSENSAVVHEKVYDAFIEACKAEGAYFIKEGTPEYEAMRKTLWPAWPENHVLSRQTPGRTADKVLELAGIDAPKGVSFVLIEENGGIGHDYPLTGEKLCPVTTIIKTPDFETALDKMSAILEYQGNGHSCGIHTKNDEQVDKMAQRMTVARILVNQPQALGNSGAWFNGMPITMSLGCATWGHNSTCNNLTWHDIVNYTTVSRPIEAVIPTEEELFDESIRNA